MELRTNPSLRYLIMLILGIVSTSFFKIPLFPLLAVLAFFFLLVIMSFLKPVYSYFRFALLPIFFGLGIISEYIYNDLNKADHYIHQPGFQKYLAIIDSPTETKPKTYKVSANVMAIDKNKIWKKTSGQIILYFNKEAGVFPHYGEVFLIKNNLREIEPPKNPLEFNYKQYQGRKNIFSHQFLREGDFKKTGRNVPNAILNFAYALNRYTHSVFKAILNDSKELGVAEALIAGMKSELDFETRQWFSATGAIHVLAVSGMHVAILFLVINALLGIFLNRKRFPFIISVLIILWSYAVFTGLSPSVVRATIMFSMIQIGIFFKREGESLNTLFVSALVILIFMPNWIFDVGFQLSYLAVAGILVLHPYLNRIFVSRYRIIRWIWEISMVSVSAQIFTLPLTIYYFHQFPNYFLLANPIVSLLSSVLLPLGLIVLFLFKIPYLGLFLGAVFKYFLVALNYSVYLIQELPYALTTGFSISIFSVITLFLIIFLLVKYIKIPETYLLKSAAILILFLFFQASIKTHKQNLQSEITFHFIPNGWGISMVNGRNATFISTDSLANEPLIHQYHLKNYYDDIGISNLKQQYIADEGNWIIKSKSGKNIQWIKGKVTAPIEYHSEYLIISGNAIRDFETLQNYNGKIILDGSNSKKTIEKLKSKAKELNKDIIVLYDTGSQTFKI